MTPNRIVEAESQASAYRIIFQAAPRGGSEILFKFGGRGACVAACEPLSAMALKQAADPSSEDHALEVVCLAPGEPSSEWQEWLANSASHGEGRSAEAAIHGGRLRWRGHRALFTGPKERLNDALAGFAYFAFYEKEIERLERDVNANWETAQRDLELTHKLEPSALRRWQDVEKMTEWVLLSRIAFARLRPCLERPSGQLPAYARDVVSELGDRERIAERLETLDDDIEVFEGIYELANDRISEFSYFLREYRAEVWIIGLLVAEALLLVVDIAMGLYR
jgi:hypothetical protein